jgi:predicted DsbA family dithiol-disulfide isomerase
MPTVVQQEQAPDRVTVVEFIDFQCPACRAQYAEFKSIAGHYEGKVHFVLKNVPLPQHEHAMDAARAFCCAEENGEAHAMADRLFAANQLTPKDCEEIAVSLGLDREEFRNCVRSQWVEDRLRADQDAAATVGIRGLPTFWIGEERFEGVHERTVLRSSIERALRRSRQS